MLAEHRLFFEQFLLRYHETGAIAPSSRWLAEALVSDVARPSSVSRKILEVGPGTGAVTGRLVRKLQPHDRLVLVELNDRFVGHLERRFESDAVWKAVAAQSEIVHSPVQDLPGEAVFDLIVSGLPLNNFSVELVEQILATFERLLKPGGTLSFFEYPGVRPARAVVSLGRDRARLSGISAALDRMFQNHPTRRQWILPNLPPAVVHHVQLAG
ncbi:MAG TPA: methyltransferase domain-containing protein [Pirellulales bacterium]|jgi:phospholipid N-methyltransferase|nr:methyltransferase domain-containing protein [Pirellulales bacterium]